jgi:hypothetical protein
MAILATERVPTLDYWKPAHKLQVGDYVFDKDGKIVRVTMVKEYRARSCYRVRLDDHLSVSGDEHLGFMVENKKYREKVWKYKGHFKFRRPLRRTTTSMLLELPLVNNRNRKEYSVPTTKPLAYPHQDLPVPPFVFGFWFFNIKSTKKLSTTEPNHDYIYEKFKDAGYKVKKFKQRQNNREFFSITPSIESQLVPHIPNKIPNNYLFSSAEQRIELLSGIMMSKSLQYNERTDKFHFSSVHYDEVKRVQALTESLGIKTRLEYHSSSKCYIVSFKTKLRLLPNQVSPPIKVHQARRFIVGVDEIQDQACVHIETTGDDNTILVGEGFIPTC